MQNDGIVRILNSSSSRFATALDYRTYRHDDQSPAYGTTTTKKLSPLSTRVLINHLELRKFSRKDRWKGMAIRVLVSCLSNNPKRSLMTYISPPGTTTSYPKVRNYLLAKYASDEIVFQTESQIRNIAQKADQHPTEYADYITSKVARCKSNSSLSEFSHKSVRSSDLNRLHIHILISVSSQSTPIEDTTLADLTPQQSKRRHP